jgi:D-sedoheptulose 7-phosphate isomerase
MENLMQEKIREQILGSVSVITSMKEDVKLILMIQTIAEVCILALKNGNKLLFMGNGGSAAGEPLCI